MNKEIIIAKIKRQQAEIQEMIAQLKEDRRNTKVVETLKKRCKETKYLIETLQEKSFFPKGVEGLDVEPQLKKIEKKVGKVRLGVKKMKQLDKKKQEIEKEMDK